MEKPTTTRTIMKARISSCLAPIIFLTTISLAEAPAAAKIYRLGYLGGATGMDDREMRLRRALRELGYTEGANLTIEWRFANGSESRLPQLAAELVRLNPELIVTHGTEPARALKNATATIPI